MALLSRGRWLTAGLAAVAVLTVGGCTDEESPIGISVEMYTPAGGTNPFQNVQWLRVRVEGDGLTSGSHSTFVPFKNEGSAALDSVPFGTNRQVIIEGWTAGADGNPAALVSRGASVRANVTEGKSEQTLPVLVSRINDLSPLTDSINRTVQQLQNGRLGHTVTKTPGGSIVIAGGGRMEGTTGTWWDATTYSELDNTIEIINELDNRTRLHDLALFFERAWHTATPLSTGQVLFAGGISPLNGQRQATPMVEVYPAPSPEQRVLAAQLSKPRMGHSATLIADEAPSTFKVLLVGGDVDGTGTYEIYSPFTGSEGAVPLPDGSVRRFHTATLFDVPSRPGQPAVLICGGEGPSGPLDTCLVFDPSTSAMVTLGGSLGAPRMHHTATFVPGRSYVYLVGGYSDAARSTTTAVIDVYDTGANKILPGQLNLKNNRAGHTATLLPNNGVLLSGGVGAGGSPLSSVEVIHEYLDPDLERIVINVVASEIQGDGTVLVPFLTGARVGQQAVFMSSGVALLVGGAENTGGTWSMPRDLTFYNPL